MNDQKSPRRAWPWIAGAAAVLIAAGIGVAAFTGVFSTEDPAPQASESTVSETRSRPPVTPAPAPEPTSTPAPAARVTIAATEEMPYSDVWTPPDHGEYFWQVVDPAAGYPAAGGTDFVLAHACENQQCAGDQLRTLEIGDVIDYKGELFVVQESREIMKVDIAAQDIWYHDPNRLVVITCIIDTTWDQSDKNDLIIATRYTG